MKKLLLLFCAIAFLSCSKEDETPNDPIVATWKYSQMIKTPLTGAPVIIEGNECTKKETATFSNNGKVDVLYYHYGNGSDCTLNETASGTFDWEKISQGRYNISRGGNTGTTYEVSFPNPSTLQMTVQLASANGQWQSYTYVYRRI